MLYPLVLYRVLLNDSRWWSTITLVTEPVPEEARLSYPETASSLGQQLLSERESPMLTAGSGVEVLGEWSIEEDPDSMMEMGSHGKPSSLYSMGGSPTLTARTASRGGTARTASRGGTERSRDNSQGIPAPLQGPPHLQLGCISLGEEFAKGSYARVLLGTYCGERCAFKEFYCAHLSEKTVPALIRREALAAWRLQHETVVEFWGFCVDPPKVYLAFEFCEQGSLFDVLHKPRRHHRGPVRILWAKRVRMAWDCARAIEHLHAFEYVHRDIKSLNFLVGKSLDGEDQVKLADFGESKCTQDHMTARQAGTLHWMAPEVVKERGYSKAADVYSLAVVVWEILTQQEPYKGIPLHEVPMRVVAGMRPSIPDYIPNALAEAIRAAWNPVPERRPDAAHFRLVLAGTPVADQGLPLAVIVSAPMDAQRLSQHCAGTGRLSRPGLSPRKFGSEEEKMWCNGHTRRLSLASSDPLQQTYSRLSSHGEDPQVTTEDPTIQEIA